MASTQTQTAVRPATGTYTIDPSHSGVTFTGRHLMISKVRGRFAVNAGTVVIAEDPEPVLRRSDGQRRSPSRAAM